MEPPLRSASFQTTVKCLSCAQETDLSSIAEHVCSPSSNVSETSYPPQSMPIPPTRMHNLPPFESPSNSRPMRPTLARIDSSVSVANRSGLHPNEAASIAHDLGLPSPISAGGTGRKSPHGSRSRSRSRKASTPRPPSTDLPLSQDCAFPPFPMKPKRSQPDRDVSNHKPRSTSRANTHPKPAEQASVHSSSSSVFSGSGPLKRRVSNTSSDPRSRKETIDDSVSVPSTTASSPRQSEYSMPSNAEQSIGQSHRTPPLVSSQASVLSDPASSVSAGIPPTPLWSSHTDQPSVQMTDSSRPVGDLFSNESTVPGHDVVESIRIRQHDAEGDGANTFDKILRPEQLRTSVDMFDNPPQELGYKANRPAPLSQPQRRNTDDIAGPRSARLPPGSQAGGLTRTLTSLFRKRSQSASSKKMPLSAVDGPRMRALAPEPPPLPPQDPGQWDDIAVADNAESLTFPSSAEPMVAQIPTRGDSLATEDRRRSPELSPTEIEDLPDHGGQAQFDFKFSNESSEHVQEQPEHALKAVKTEQFEALQAAEPAPEQIDTALQRASIDSASSYGSIGFSNRTTSSRSSFPPSDDTRRKASTALDAESSHLVHDISAASEDAQSHELGLESPTDPLYRHGRLSPVPEAQAVRWPLGPESESEAEPRQQSEQELQQEPEPESESEPQVTSEIESVASASPRKKLLPPMNDVDVVDRTRGMRPATPGAVKGRCRGCSNLILAGQKSVASADGRLTGRYHKECFVCQTCKEAFSTADFYVHNDQPYCAHHYHVINNTLCTGCGKGIEGQYLETHDVSGGGTKKFHHKCLQCSTCRVQLHEDYFEFHGRVYCERDAFRAANGPRSPYDTVPSRPSPLVREYISSGEPGLKGRFPERRTTRLIMT